VGVWVTAFMAVHQTLLRGLSISGLRLALNTSTAFLLAIALPPVVTLLGDCFACALVTRLATAPLSTAPLRLLAPPRLLCALLLHRLPLPLPRLPLLLLRMPRCRALLLPLRVLLCRTPLLLLPPVRLQGSLLPPVPVCLGSICVRCTFGGRGTFGRRP
jgi:hypothetical protein